MIDLLEILIDCGIAFFTGVPDSLLAPFCDEVFSRYGTDPRQHVVAHNEGGSVGIAAGYYLATGKVPCVYLQNSGIGNIVNPVVSLTSPLVYDIPILYVVGWRGESGIIDEPQHKFQGMITEDLLHIIGLNTFIIERETNECEIRQFLSQNRYGNAALLVKKGTLIGRNAKYESKYALSREDAIKRIAQEEGVIVSSTGKISRELYETGRKNIFLTVGSMGHDSMIALGIALQKPNVKVWCIQGDGAFIMHLGAIAIAGANVPDNFHYIVLNNAAHESVGGMPSCAAYIGIAEIAEKCGFIGAVTVSTIEELDKALQNESLFIEVRCALGSRYDLGRPTCTPCENKLALMRTLE